MTILCVGEIANVSENTSFLNRKQGDNVLEVYLQMVSSYYQDQKTEDLETGSVDMYMETPAAYGPRGLTPTQSVLSTSSSCSFFSCPLVPPPARWY